MKPTNDFRQILKDTLETRIMKNPSYSLRAFARDLGVSPTSLSLILNGKQGLSKKGASRLGSKLGLTGASLEYFCDSVESQHGRSPQLKREARARLKGLGTEIELKLETFKVIADWYHLAILELTTLKKFQSNTRWIAKTLGINESITSQAIERLRSLKLLTETDGELRQSDQFLATPSDTPSEFIRSFHHQLLEKAKTALDEQVVEERDFSGIILTLSKEDLDWAKSEIRKFRRSLMERLEENPNRDQLYYLGIQLFGLEARVPQTLSTLQSQELKELNRSSTTISERKKGE